MRIAPVLPAVREAVDAYLAASVLAGVALNALLGWWWADPLAALIMVYYGIREGLHACCEGVALEAASERL